MLRFIPLRREDDSRGKEIPRNIRSCLWQIRSIYLRSDLPDLGRLCNT